MEMRRSKHVCSHWIKAAVKPSQQLSSFHIVSLWDILNPLAEKCGALWTCHLIWLVNCLTKDILDFPILRILQQIPFLDAKWVFKEAKAFYLDSVGLTVFIWPEEGLAFEFLSTTAISRFLWLSVWTCCGWNTSEHKHQNVGFVCTVTFDSIQHLASDSLDSLFPTVAMRACHIFKRTNAKTPEDDCFGQKHFKAPTQMNYCSHPASQHAFRYPSKHLSHLWLDPCCLDTVHAVVIGPYPNQ